MTTKLASRWRQVLGARRLPSTSTLTLFAIFAAAIAFYAPSFRYWFYNDDFLFLRAAQSRPFGSYVAAAFNYNHEQYVPPYLYRPLFLVVFRGLYAAFGLHAVSYHVLGLAAHLACGVMLWRIAVRITGRQAIAQLATLIFLLHPTYSVAVAFVANNNVVFGTLLYLTSLLLFLRYLDGGRGRLLAFGASLLTFVAAVLIDPETTYVAGLIVLSYALLRPVSRAELLSARVWTQLVPFVVLAAGLMVLEAYARQASYYQLVVFKLGPHMASNYARYTAFAINPYRAWPSANPFTTDLSPVGDWRVLILCVCGVAAGLLLLVLERVRPRPVLFVLTWFALAVLPLSTWIAGAAARKLYEAGPPFALAAAMVMITAWDALSKHLSTFPRRLIPAVLLLLMTLALGTRVLQMTRAFGDGTDVYHAMVTDARASYPTLPEGSRLYLVGVPYSMILLGPDSAGVASSLQLYYGPIEVIPVSHEKDLATLPRPPGENDPVVRYRCPPVCQPPIATAKPSTQ